MAAFDFFAFCSLAFRFGQIIVMGTYICKGYVRSIAIAYMNRTASYSGSFGRDSVIEGAMASPNLRYPKNPNAKYNRTTITIAILITPNSFPKFRGSFMALYIDN